ncbi:putative non-structural maintenance of chromosome element 4 [Triangularia verruculosa]|uniref:Non-structural maintenance of chromosomes element 4 n=1 Tax=Triangularia verruculosa TaxID=2587418 RepID=A0AAN7AWU7_9PEZI|nr:putative non-structural maintenance of chromosome element 4 [Triangularia verruculosa]
MESRNHLAARGRNGHDGGGNSSRKRASDVGGEPQTSRRRTRDPSVQADRGGDDEYDPAQPMQERRQIQRSIRETMKEVLENQDRLMGEDAHPFLNVLDKQDNTMINVKQTNEAAMDSRVLVTLADIGVKRAQKLGEGNIGGLDLDELVSKASTFMRTGGGIEDDAAAELSSTQRRRRQPARGALGSDDEDAGDEGDMANWMHLGRYATIPAILRPSLPGFLLGPLSIEKKARKITKRSAPFKISSLQEVRPQELRPEDLKQNSKNDLPSICKKIWVRLSARELEAQELAQKKADQLEEEQGSELSEDRTREIMDQYGLNNNGIVDLLRFVINPRSYGQTVENMFYVSFLIREGSIELKFDQNGLPGITPFKPTNNAAESQSRARAPMRHQAIMSIDMETWRAIIETFDIKEPIIPHRQEDEPVGPGAHGWYN